MVAQTPLVSLDPESEELWSAAYRAGWVELNRAMRRGDPWSGKERNVAFLQVARDGAQAFVDAAPLLGLDGEDDGRSAARMDVDFDGDDDIVVSNRTAPRLRVFQNRLADGVPHLAIRVEGTDCNREAVGAVVYATPMTDTEAFEFVPGVSQRRTRTAGEGYLAQSSEWLRFAFGSQEDDRRARRIRVAVAWPGAGGVLEEFGTVRTGRAFVLKQGAGSARAFAAPAPCELAPAPVSEPDAATLKSRLILPWPRSIPSLSVRSKSGQVGSIFGRTLRGPRGTGKPAVLLAWDSRDPDALNALGDLRGLAKRAGELGISYLAIDIAPRGSVDTIDPLLTGDTRLMAAGWNGDVLGAVGETQSILEEVIGWRLDQTDPPDLPWSLLLDPNGRVYAMRRGPWVEGELERDMVLLNLEPDARVAAASAFGGRWLVPPGEVSLARFRERLASRGAVGAVRELDLARVKTNVSKSAVDIAVGKSLLAQKKTAEAVVAFERAILAEPDNALAHRALAYALHLEGRYREALDAWSKALDIDPSDNETVANRALAAVQAGELDIARKDLEELKSRGPEARRAMEAVATALKKSQSMQTRQKGDGR